MGLTPVHEHLWPEQVVPGLLREGEVQGERCVHGVIGSGIVKTRGVDLHPPDEVIPHGDPGTGIEHHTGEVDPGPGIQGRVQDHEVLHRDRGHDPPWTRIQIDPSRRSALLLHVSLDGRSIGSIQIRDPPFEHDVEIDMHPTVPDISARGVVRIDDHHVGPLLHFELARACIVGQNEGDILIEPAPHPDEFEVVRILPKGFRCHLKGEIIGPVHGIHDLRDDDVLDLGQSLYPVIQPCPVGNEDIDMIVLIEIIQDAGPDVPHLDRSHVIGIEAPVAVPQVDDDPLVIEPVADDVRDPVPVRIIQDQ